MFILPLEADDWFHVAVSLQNKVDLHATLQSPLWETSKVLLL
jgi:hypothetical protein